MDSPPRSLPLTFRGSAALVTGAASGIGAAAARRLMLAGITTVRVDRVMPEPLGNAAEGPRIAADVTDIGGLDAAVRDAAGDVTIEYVVNCAGILRNTGFADVPRETWLRSLEVNLVGAYNVINAVRPQLERARSGAVVNVTSVEADRVVALSDPDPNPAYAASKAGLAMLTRTAARALAGARVRVNSVSPGFVATPMAAAHGGTGQLPPALAPRVPLARFATADEVADVIVFPAQRPGQLHHGC